MASHVVRPFFPPANQEARVIYSRSSLLFFSPTPPAAWLRPLRPRPRPRPAARGPSPRRRREGSGPCPPCLRWARPSAVGPGAGFGVSPQPRGHGRAQSPTDSCRGARAGMERLLSTVPSQLVTVSSPQRRKHTPCV